MRREWAAGEGGEARRPALMLCVPQGYMSVPCPAHLPSPSTPPLSCPPPSKGRGFGPRALHGVAWRQRRWVGSGVTTCCGVPL